MFYRQDLIVVLSTYNYFGLSCSLLRHWRHWILKIFSKRKALDQNLNYKKTVSLWCGWLLPIRDHNICFFYGLFYSIHWELHVTRCHKSSCVLWPFQPQAVKTVGLLSKHQNYSATKIRLATGTINFSFLLWSILLPQHNFSLISVDIFRQWCDVRVRQGPSYNYTSIYLLLLNL